jgi:KEOPS complex subunit Cgi121
LHHAILARARVAEVAAALEAADAVGKRHGVTLALFDADAVYNARHLESAIAHAERAFSQGRNSGKTLAAEIFLYLTGERQVERALEQAGLRPGLERAVVLAIGYKGGAAIWDLLDRLKWSKDPTGLVDNPRALARYGLADANGGAEAAVLERVALLDVRK